jgi:hypothetical protein
VLSVSEVLLEYPGDLLEVLEVRMRNRVRGLVSRLLTSLQQLVVLLGQRLESTRVENRRQWSALTLYSRAFPM